MVTSNELTITDVAKASGVSVSTVSRILNGKQDVAKATREHVLQVIDELGYAPHAQAQSLRAGKTRNLGLLFPLKDPGNVPYNSLDIEFIVSAAAAAEKQNFFFILLTASVTEQSLLNLYRSAQIDGLVLMQVYSEDWRVDLLRKNGYPFVMIGHTENNEGLSFIDLDFKGAVIAAFEPLIQQGHRQIAFISLPNKMRQEGYGPALRTWEGYQRIIEQYHIPAIYREVNFGRQEAFDATLALLDEVHDLSAIITTHADGALSIIQALNERGMRIPDDCSVIALTANRMAELTTPTLTNLDFPAHDMGDRAVDMLLRMLRNELTEPEQVLIPPKLILRNSTNL